MNLGVTGSHGFVGSHLHEELIKRHRALGIGVYERFDRARYNLLHIDSMKLFVRDKDVILHLAGVNRTNNNDFIAVNTLGTLNLLEAIRRYSVSNEIKFIFASSLQVYGFISIPKLLKEFFPLRPTNMYGLSKKFAEEIIYRYCQDYGIKGIVLRISNVYGSRCRPFYNSVISTFIYLALNGCPITISGSGNSSRDFIYVKDVINALLKSMNYRGNTPSTFNVCTGTVTSVKELVKKLSTIISKNIKINWKKGGPDDFIIGDPSKARKILSFKSETSLEEGLKETLKWFKEGLDESGDQKTRKT